jgi:predicted transcriptional regulator of viral defense system
LAPPYQKVKPHPFVIANRMVQGSYVSCQSALAHFGLIPENVPTVTSVSTGRPCRWNTPLGDLLFRHVKVGLLRGYRMVDLGGGQQALVAKPEKALLDLAHLQPGGDSTEYLRELRLQNLERLDLAELRRLVELLGSPKLGRVAAVVAEFARAEAKEYETL